MKISCFDVPFFRAGLTGTVHLRIFPVKDKTMAGVVC